MKRWNVVFHVQGSYFWFSPTLQSEQSLYHSWIYQPGQWYEIRTMILKSMTCYTYVLFKNITSYYELSIITTTRVIHFFFIVCSDLWRSLFELRNDRPIIKITNNRITSIDKNRSFSQNISGNNNYTDYFGAEKSRQRINTRQRKSVRRHTTAWRTTTDDWRQSQVCWVILW